jgi:hypothetical protein
MRSTAPKLRPTQERSATCALAATNHLPSITAAAEMALDNYSSGLACLRCEFVGLADGEVLRGQGQRRGVVLLRISWSGAGWACSCRKPPCALHSPILRRARLWRAWGSAHHSGQSWLVEPHLKLWQRLLGSEEGAIGAWCGARRRPSAQDCHGLVSKLGPRAERRAPTIQCSSETVGSQVHCASYCRSAHCLLRLLGGSRLTAVCSDRRWPASRLDQLCFCHGRSLPSCRWVTRAVAETER